MSLSNYPSTACTADVRYRFGQGDQHAFIPVEALIWIRSLAIVLLIVAHALHHVQAEQKTHADVPTLPPAPPVFTPELINELRALLAQASITLSPGRMGGEHERTSPRKPPQTMKANRGKHRANKERTAMSV